MFKEKRCASRYETLLEAEIRLRKIHPRNLPGIIINHSCDGVKFISENFHPKLKDMLEVITNNPLINCHATGEIVWYKQVNTRCYVGLKFKEKSHFFTSALSLRIEPGLYLHQ